MEDSSEVSLEQEHHRADDVVSIEQNDLGQKRLFFVEVDVVLLVEFHADDSLNLRPLVQQDSLCDLRAVDRSEIPLIGQTLVVVGVHMGQKIHVVLAVICLSIAEVVDDDVGVCDDSHLSSLLQMLGSGCEDCWRIKFAGSSVP